MSCDFISAAHPAIQALNPYIPGKPISEVEREFGINNIIKLASNENPLGASPKALQAIQNSLHDIAIYPDGSGYELKHALSKKCGVPPEQLTLGNGSDSLFLYLAQSYVQPGEEIIISQYGFYTFFVVAHIVQSKIITVPMQEWQYDLDGILKAITPKTRLIFIANPNNPTGTWINETDLTNFLKKVPDNVLVLLDEAYYEYVDSNRYDYPNAIALQKSFPNLFITRTFSKIYGLASLRVGYGISNPDIANIINRVRLPFNICSQALVAAVAALEDTEFTQKAWIANQQGMEYMTTALDKLNIPYLSSLGNFVTIDVKRDCNDVFQALLAKGVIVRPLASYGMPTHLRVTIGTEPQNNRFLKTLQEVLYL